MSVPMADLAAEAAAIATRYAALPSHAAKAAKACITAATATGINGFEEVQQRVAELPKTRDLVGAFLAGTNR